MMRSFLISPHLLPYLFPSTQGHQSKRCTVSALTSRLWGESTCGVPRSAKRELGRIIFSLELFGSLLHAVRKSLAVRKVRLRRQKLILMRSGPPGSSTKPCQVECQHLRTQNSSPSRQSSIITHYHQIVTITSVPLRSTCDKSAAP
ncbi:hypothetical protein BJY04DRAFT_175767 [Aspergillus karnatakaensis]|uniref:uncharacterized protein n=1 Tax=Aspergillus karnatakaensis TaxID=1810916 RepID=UPI003CCE32B6